MNKVISIFLLSIMMLIAAHPVIAMHYCEGELYSFNLFQTNDEMECCDGEHQNDTTHNHIACCANTADHNYKHNISLQSEDCCDYDTMQVSTDEFQHISNNISWISLISSIANNWFTINDLFTLSQPETNLTSFEYEFPSKGLFMEDICILTYICIYRI